MSDRATPSLPTGPVTDRSGRITGVGRLIFVSFGLVGISLGFVLIKPTQAEPFVIGLLAVLAVVGLVALLAGAIGIVRFSVKTEGEDLGRALLEATGERWYRIKARPLAAGRRQRPMSAWTVADISQERARQETVFQELQHAIDYLDHAPAGFFSAEPDGRIVYLNATLAEWLGIDLARFEAGSLTLADIVRGDGVALLTAPPAGEMRNRTAVIDLDLIKQNGQSLPVRLLHRVPVTADGAPGATRTLVLNRSPGEDVSEALRAAEVRFARFFNNTPIAIAAIDRGGRIGRPSAVPERGVRRMFGTAARWGRRRLVDPGRRGGPAEARGGARRRPTGRRQHPADRRGPRPRRRAAAPASTSTRSPRAPAGSRR